MPDMRLDTSGAAELAAVLPVPHRLAGPSRRPPRRLAGRVRRPLPACGIKQLRGDLERFAFPPAAATLPSAAACGR
jgi:hypothetical protein